MNPIFPKRHDVAAWPRRVREGARRALALGFACVVGLSVWITGAEAERSAAETPASAVSDSVTAAASAESRKVAAALSDSAAAHAEEAWLDESATLIRALIEGELPGDFAVQSLFEVDLLDEPAVSRRREALQATILERRKKLGGRASVDTIAVAASASSNSTVGVDGAASGQVMDSAATHSTARSDTMAPDSLAVAPARARVGPETLRLIRKRNVVDKLRLTFLRLPAERRQEINETERRRRELLEEKEAAQRAREEAELLAVEAEERRRVALEEARQKQSMRLEQLANEIARAETFHSGLARLGAELATRREQEVGRANAELQAMLELQRGLETSEAGSVQIWPIYSRAVGDLAIARPLLRTALGDWFAPSDVPTFAPAIDVAAIQDTATTERVATLRKLYAEIAVSRQHLTVSEKDIRWQILDYRAERVRQAGDLRIRALAKLPAHRRGQVLGLTPHGVQALGDELDQLVLSAKFYFVSRLRNLHHVPGRLDDMFAVGTATYILLRTLAMLLAVIFIYRRAPSIVEGMRRGVLEGVRDTHIREQFTRFLASIAVVAPWLYFLMSVASLRWAMGDAALWPEVSILVQTLLLFGLYRLGLVLSFRSVVNLTKRDAFNKEPRRLVKLFATFRAVLRVGFVIAIFLMVSERFLGRGFLYYLAHNVAWVGGFAVVFGLLHGWREIIGRAYIQVRPEGRLPALVRATRNRWYGFMVGGAAFMWLAGHAGLRFARDFALGFDQVRKALAFLVRKRIEKRAETQGYSEGAFDQLPGELLRAFEQGATGDERLIVDHFPGLGDLEAALNAWCETGTRGTFLLTGERGMGKTSWLNRVRTDRVPATYVLLESRVRTPQELWDFLIPQLAPGLDPGLGSRGLEQVLASGKQRLVIFDGCQNLFLGTVGGYQAFEAFVTLADATHNRVFWLCAANGNAWAHLEAVRPDLGLFAYRQDLKPWSEERIRELIETRTRAAAIELDYGDVLTDPTHRADDRHTESGYLRLLWDYADGNPRVALHFWLRSLVPAEDGAVRIRLFRAPTAERLQEIGEVAMFILASIVLHENLTVEEAAAATRYNVGVCRSHMDRLEEEGILMTRDNRYRLATYWHRAVIRQLRRGNMLAQSAAA